MKHRRFDKHEHGHRPPPPPHGRKGRHHKGGRRERGRLFGSGELRIAFLALLNDGPAHGYELMQRLSDKTGGRYEPSAGATYPILQQLQDEDLATVDETGGKKVYHLTEAGQSVVTENEDHIRHIWNRAAKWRRWSALDGPEIGDIPELRELMKTVVDILPEAEDPDSARAKIREILADAIGQVRAVS